MQGLVRKNNRFLIYTSLAILLLVIQYVTPVLITKVGATPLSHSYIRVSRMKAATGGSTPNDIRVVFRTNTAGATGYTIDFNGADTSTWTGNGGAVAASGMTVSNVTFGNCDGATATPAGSPTASGSGSVLTISSVTALSANQTYCWDITKASTGVVTTPSAGEYHPVITPTGGSTDTAITDDIDVISNDQLSVTATVVPVFNMAITSGCGSNIDALSKLSYTSVISTTGCTWTVNTNAANGWYVWVKDTGLTSATNGHTITGSSTASVSDLSGTTGTEGYGIAISASPSAGGSCATGITCSAPTAAALYDSTASGSKVGGMDSTFRTLVSSTTPNNAATFATKERANINVTTPAATDYTDTITVVGAGYF